MNHHTGVAATGDGFTPGWGAGTFGPIDPEDAGPGADCDVDSDGVAELTVAFPALPAGCPGWATLEGSCQTALQCGQRTARAVTPSGRRASCPHRGHLNPCEPAWCSIGCPSPVNRSWISEGPLTVMYHTSFGRHSEVGQDSRTVTGRVVCTTVNANRVRLGRWALVSRAPPDGNRLSEGTRGHRRPWPSRRSFHVNPGFASLFFHRWDLRCNGPRHR